ncbi:MAG: WYL domain-containing protein [Clostridiales bacterium]|nr:WYL domain-containing protein [Clostridiales bacterium]
MRRNELEILKVIDCLLQNEKLTLTGEKNSFYANFNIMSDGKGGYDDSKSPIKYKSLQREVKRLCDCNIFIKEHNEYRINPKYIVLEQPDKIKEWREFVKKLLESGEYDTYLLVTKYMLGADSFGEYLDETEIQMYHHTVKEAVNSLKADKNVIHSINQAFDEKLGLEIEYKGRDYSVIPICYVVSQDGTRTYLYSERKKTLFQPMDLRYIKVKRYYKADVDKDKYIEQIRKTWDIDIQDSVYVKLLYDKKAAEDDYLDEKEIIENMLESRFGHPTYRDKENYVYEGEIYGINDLKIWLRTYSEYCFILEPRKLRDEFVEALRIKKERYEHDR